MPGKQIYSFKGTVSVISSELPYKKRYTRFTRVPLIQDGGLFLMNQRLVVLEEFICKLFYIKGYIYYINNTFQKWQDINVIIRFEF